MMTMIRSSVLTMTLAMFSVAYAPSLLAETDAEQSAPDDQSAQSEPSSPSYSDQELRSFAVAVLEVERIKSSYAPKLAQNLREQAQVKQAASLELLMALKQQGISVDKYQEMLSTVQSNPELAGKVNEYIQNSANEKGSRDESDAKGGESNGKGGTDESSRKPRSRDTDATKHVEQL
jgi:Domain of unknown function (DUF4168)